MTSETLSKVTLKKWKLLTKLYKKKHERKNQRTEKLSVHFRSVWSHLTAESNSVRT